MFVAKKVKKLKLKTHRGAAKRFKITSTGKVMRMHSGKRHLLGTKKANRMRRLKKMTLGASRGRQKRPQDVAVRLDDVSDFVFAVPGRAQPATVGLPASGSGFNRGIAHANVSRICEFRVGLLNTPWRCCRFLIVCRFPCAGTASMFREALRLRTGENTMARVKRGSKRRARRKKYLRRAKGFLPHKIKALPVRAGSGQSRGALFVPRPPRAQAPVPQVVDSAHRRGRAAMPGCPTAS